MPADTANRVRGHLQLPLFRTAYALILSNVLTSGLGLVYWLLGARLYSPEAVGINSALLSTMTFLSGIAQLNLRSALNRFIPESGRDAGLLIALCYLLTIPASAVVVGAFVVLVSVLAPAAPVAVVLDDHALLAWFIVATASWGIVNMQDGVLTGLQRAGVIPFENFSFALAKIVLLVVFTGPIALYGIFASWTIPAVMLVIIVTLWIYRSALPRAAHLRRPSARTFTPREFIRFAASDYFGALLVLIYVSLLPVIVISAVGAQNGAYFYIVWTIATSLNLIPLSLSISHTVETVAARADPVAEARTVLIHLLKVLIPVVVLVLVAAPLILGVFGPGYAEAGADLLRLLALGVVPYGVNVLYFSLARIQRRLRGVVLAQVFLAITTPIASLALLPAMGITGVGVVWLGSQGVLAIVLLATALRPVIQRTAS